MKKEYRVKKSKEFQSIIEKKKSVGCSTLVIYYSKNELDHIRVGISSGKRLGNAVVRNRTKRRIRALIDEVFNFNESMDYIVIVRNKFIEQDYESNLKDLKYLLDKIKKNK